MKQVFILLSSLLLIPFSTNLVYAQQNIFIWKDGGHLSIISSEDIDSLSFSVDTWLFNISTSTAVSVTNNSFKAMASVSLNENVKSLSVTPEIGVCYSSVDSLPTYADSKVKLGYNMNDYIVDVSFLAPGTTYYYRTYVKLLEGVYYDAKVNTITTLGNKPQDKIINGHKFIDLGLPSGLLWAETNVGASTPYEVGDYYAWGEIDTKSSYGWSTYKWGNDKKNLSKYNLLDGKTMLETADDAAAMKWGKECRMPSSEDFAELCRNCRGKWVSNYNGASGILWTGPSGHNIFFPACGYHSTKNIYDKSSSVYIWGSEGGQGDAVCYGDYKDDDAEVNMGCYMTNPRCEGLTVRPVAKR